MKSKRTRRAFASALLFGSTVFSTGSLFAEKPAVTGLFPAGGQIGQTLEVEPVGKLGSQPIKVWTDREELSAEVTQDGKKLQVNIAPEAAPGVYWLRVWNAEGASTLRPFLVGRLPEVEEKETNETLSDAQAIEATGTVINGKLPKSGELDTYKVTLKKDQTLVADLLGNTLLKSPMDAVLQVFSAEGFLLAHADDSPKLDPRLAFTAPQDGDYFVRVFAFPETATSSIRYAGGADYIYRLTLTTGPYAHHPMPLVKTEGETTKLQLAGWNQPPDSPPLDGEAAEAHLAERIEVPTAATFALAAVNHPSFVESDISGPLAPPFSLSGSIGTADEVDSFPVTAKKGETLVVSVKSAALGFPLDPVLEIKDAQGGSLKVIDDKARGEEDAEFTWKVAADGEYQIHITDRYQHGGWEYAYLLTVEQPKPDFGLSIAADAFTLTADKPLEIPVTVTRSNGFAENIELQIDGLPEGIKVESEVSEAKGKTAKSVKLKLTATGKEPFHGPIWIKGKAGDLLKTATTPTTAASPKAQHAWISFEPKK